MMSFLLPCLVLFPLLMGSALLIMRRRGLTDSAGEAIGVATAFVLLLLSFIALMSVGSAAALKPASVIVSRLEFTPAWLILRLPAVLDASSSGWQLSLGLDGIGLTMVLLTSLVTLAVILVSRSTVTHERSDFGAWILCAASGLMLTFTAMDLILFYVGFELTLLPLFPLIVKWGDEDAGPAAKRFVLYTLAGSIPMILGLLGIAQLYANEAGWTVYLPELSRRAAAAASDGELLDSQRWIFGFLVLGLGIKMALMPFHTWLPKTYGACHATAGAFLAAVVLKLGLFGFVRLAIPMVPQASELYGPTVMGGLGVFAIVAGALMALAQADLRRLLAYSSLSHVGFVTLGLFAMNEEGINGGVLQMFNHGITTAAGFLGASCLIARRGTADLASGSHGLAIRYPTLALIMVFFLAAGAGVPGLNNFVGETLTLTAMVSSQPVVAALGTLGIVLGAWYAFRLIQVLLFGDATHERVQEDSLSTPSSDLGIRDRCVFGGLAALCLFIGVYPQIAIDVFKQDAQQLGQVCQIVEQSASTLSPLERKP